jgi:hypothetical protein
MATKRLRGVSLSVHNASDRHARDPRHHEDDNWDCTSPFYLRLDDGHRIPLCVGVTRVISPCELVVVLGEDVHTSHRVSLIAGDRVTFTCDNWDASYGGFHMPTGQNKIVEVSYPSSGYNISITTGPAWPFTTVNYVENPPAQQKPEGGQ